MRPEITLRDQAFPNVLPVALDIDVLRQCYHHRPRHRAPDPAMNSRRRIGDLLGWFDSL
jgi:hypothetical protein